MESQELIKLFLENLSKTDKDGKSVGLGIMLGLNELSNSIDRYTEFQRKSLIIQKKLALKHEELVERLEDIEYDAEEKNDESEDGEIDNNGY